MLNKLLKRCMPWMDKGRWYQIRIDYDGSVFTPVYDNSEFRNVEIILSRNFVNVTCNHVYQIIDYKFCPSGKDFAYFPDELHIAPTDDGEEFSNYIFEITFWGPGTYWFFMRWI